MAVAQFLPPEDGGQVAQRGLGEQEFAQIRMHRRRRRRIQPHVELDEESRQEVEVEIAHQVRIVDVPDPPRVVRDVEQEPHALEREAAARGERDAVFGEEGHDFVDRFFAEEDHLHPPETRDEARCGIGGFERVWVWDSLSRVGAAERGVAAPGEGAGGLGGFEEGLAEHGGGEAAVEDGVEVVADGVEVEEGGEGELRRQVEDEFGEQQDAAEDVEVRGVGAAVGEGGRGQGEAGPFALAREGGGEDGAREAVWGGVHVWGGDFAVEVGLWAEVGWWGAGGGCEGRVEGEVRDAAIG